MKYYKYLILLIAVCFRCYFGMAQGPNLDPEPQLPDGPGNPFLKGQQGSWRIKKSQAYLVNRVASRSADVPNLRTDGIFEAFDPFWSLPSGNSSDWIATPLKWTITKENTKFSPHGQVVEERNALGIYSTVQYGYNGFLVTLAASNSLYQESGFDSFEDYGFSVCTDDHFNFDNYTHLITRDEFHTGRKSIKVAAGGKVSMTRPVGSCVSDVKYIGDSSIDQIVK